MTTSGLVTRIALYCRSGPNRPQIHSFIMNRCNPSYRWNLPQTHFGPQYGSLGGKIARKWHLNFISLCGTHPLAAMGYFPRFHVLWCKSGVFGSHLAKKLYGSRMWYLSGSWNVLKTNLALQYAPCMMHRLAATVYFPCYSLFPTRHTLCSDVFCNKKVVWIEVETPS